MAAAVGNLRINLVANTAKFSTGLRSAGTRVKKFATGIRSAAKSMMGFGAAIAGVAVGGGLVVMVKRQLDAIDATAKLSQQLGVATEDLQKLRHAAELTGAGTDSLDAGLATMAKRLGEAARGSGAAAPALKELGLAASDLIAIRPDQAFREIAGALEKIESPARRNAIAANLFSKANMGLLNTLAAGKGGLKAMGDEAERLGKTFSAVDAAQIEAANDAMTRMKAALGGLATKFTIELAPYITQAAESWTEMFGSKSGVAAAGGEVSKMAKTFATIADVMHTVKLGFQGAYVAIAAIGKEVRTMLYKIAQAGEKFGLFTSEDVAILKQQAKAASKIFDQLREDFKKAWEGKTPSELAAIDARLRALAGSANAAGDALAEMGTTISAADVIKELQEAIDNFGKSSMQVKIQKAAIGGDRGQTQEAQRLLGIFEQLKKEQQEMTRMQERARDLFKESLTPLEQYRVKAAEIRELLDLKMLDVGVAQKAIDEIHKKMMEAYTPNISAPSLAPAMQKGSQAAYSAIVGAKHENRWEQAMQRIGKQHLKADEDSARSLEEIRDNLDPTVEKIPP